MSKTIFIFNATLQFVDRFALMALSLTTTNLWRNDIKIGKGRLASFAKGNRKTKSHNVCL